MITTSDALELMGVVAACHYRTAPRLDDREAALVTADIWKDLFNEYRLEMPDLVRAVKKRATKFPDAPEPAEIIEIARHIRQDRSDRESAAQRAVREAACDAKALDDDDEAALARIKARTKQDAIGRGIGEQ
jgi:hypothetical protein